MQHCRRIAVVAMMTTVGLAVAGCSSSDGGSGSEEPSINVILNSSLVGDSLNKLIDDFRKSHPDIKVTTELLAEQQMRDKTQLNLQSRSSEMDVYMTLPSREGPLFADSEYYEPLDDYVADAGDDYDFEGFAPAPKDGSVVDDQLVAIPMNVEGPIMYYRKDLLKTAGVEPPETVDDLMKAAETLQSSSDGAWVPVTLRGQADALPFDFGPFFHAQGIEWTTDGKPNFDTPEAVEAIEQYVTLAGEYGPDGVANYTFQDSSNLFGSGDAAIMLETSNQLAIMSDTKTSNFVKQTAAATFPGGAPSVISWSLAMSPFSSDKDSAWEFIEWATSPETQLEMAKLGVMPPRSAIYDDKSFQATLDTSLEQEGADAISYLLSDGNTELGPVSKQAPEIRKIMGDAIGAAILGSSSPEEAAESIQQQLEPIYAAE